MRCGFTGSHDPLHYPLGGFHGIRNWLQGQLVAPACIRLKKVLAACTQW